VDVLNMIVCGEQCAHQKDGYCVLEGTPSLTAGAGNDPCGYFAPGGVMGVVNRIGSLGPLDELARDE
jgi:hypothetical protein